MKIKLLTIALIVSSFCVRSFAQDSQRPWGIGLHGGVLSHYAMEQGNFFKPEVYGWGIELSAMRSLGKWFDLGVESGFGRLRHPMDGDATNFTIRDNFFTADLALRFKFDNGVILPEDFVVSPFLKIGAGGTTFKDFKEWQVFFPAGLGINFRIPKSPINIILQSTYNYTILMDASVPASQRGFWRHSLGLAINFGKKGKKNSDNDLPPINLPVTDAPDRDYDGIADEEDRCPDIFGALRTMGCPDADNDGINDHEDKCPDQKGFANLLGCLDSDYDGVIDPEDECPDVYGDGLMGCPGKDENDIDGDGVANDVDECPDVKGLFTANGCPDADGDGIKDDIDECPGYYGIAQHNGCPIDKAEMDRLKELANAAAKNEGVANRGYYKDNQGNIRDRNENIVQIDDDGNIIDGQGNKYTETGGYTFDDDNNIVDLNGNIVKIDEFGFLIGDDGKPIAQTPIWNSSGTDPNGGNFGGIYIGNVASDKYAGIPTTGFTEPKNLSPDEQEYCQRLDLTALKAAIYFDYDRTGINNGSLRKLDKVVEAMKKCAVLELQVAGHADADGGENYNVGLSEKRAKSVLKYILGSGISDKRLKYNAYGEKYPIAPNTSDNGKQKNRRAEVRVKRAY